jgi:hypothetical protein
MKCERDGCENEATVIEPSQTCYVWDGSGNDPNADKHLCAECAVEYREIMDEMWREHNSGRL